MRSCVQEANEMGETVGNSILLYSHNSKNRNFMYKLFEAIGKANHLGRQRGVTSGGWENRRRKG